MCRLYCNPGIGIIDTLTMEIDGRILSFYAVTHNNDHDNGFVVMLEELRNKYQEWPAFKKNIARERISEF